jgi:hypothetical protein
MKVLDLCAGLGGASAAFRDRGHEIITLDVDQKFRPSIVADVRFCPLSRGGFDLILAAPPCQCFSNAALGKYWKYGPSKPVEEALEIVRACFSIIKETGPRFYVLENPRGKLRKLIGLPTETIYYCSYGHTHQKPTDLWHNLPVRLKRPCAPHARSRRDRSFVDGEVRDPAKRSLWPYALSLEICRIVEASLGLGLNP